MVNKIISRKPMIMKDIQTPGEYLEKLINKRRESMFHFNLDQPDKLRDYIGKLENIVDEVKNLTKIWNNEYYTLDVKYAYSHYLKKYVGLKFDFKFKKDGNLNYSEEPIGYIKYGIYNDKPLYISKAVYEVIDTNKLYIKEIDHDETRSRREKIVKVGHNKYVNNIVSKWFFKGIVIGEIEGERDHLWSFAITGKYDFDWFGCKQPTYRDKKIEGPIEFIVK